MQQLTLVIGNKNYSSWSLRPWLALKQAGASFQEKRIPLFVPGYKERISEVSPNGKVPCLIHGNLHIWDSLAICEYVAEMFPQAKLWPTESRARAVARSVSAEMHSGFVPLRSAMGMDIRRKPAGVTLTAPLQADIKRVQEIWRHCRTQYGHRGAFLFGEFSIADAMYAPVVMRFLTYEAHVDQLSRRYMDTITAMPAMREWIEAAQAETEVID